MTDDPYDADFLRVRRDALARGIVLAATDPAAAAAIERHLFGNHTPLARATVVSLFGEDVAQAWDDVKTAIATLKEKLK